MGKKPPKPRGINKSKGQFFENIIKIDNPLGKFD